MSVYLSSGVAESVVAAGMMCFVLLALSSPFIYAGWKNRKRFRKLSAIHADSGEKSIGEPMAVTGTIKDSPDSIHSPFRSEDCQLALWDISKLKRKGTLGFGFVWSQESLGIEGDSVTIDTENDEIQVENLSSRKVLDSSEKLKRSLMADSTSKFSSVELELDDGCFERKVKPTDDVPDEYKNFMDDISYDRPVIDSYGTIKSIVSRLRVPSDSVRYREFSFNEGDDISVVGRKTREGISFESSNSTSPLISSKPISKILRKYRLAYLFQLYVLPVFCITISAVLGYGAYL